MVIYNVTIKVEHSVADSWVKWMKTEHMRDLMALGLFTDCRLCKLVEHDEHDGLTYVAQYFCDSIDQYHTYIEQHAEEMRNRGFKAFGGKFIAFRTVMEVI